MDLGAEPTSVAAADGRRAPTVCLNMIVKNEAPVIARCLASARPFIDHWIIVDTGSTDGTQQRVRECLEGIPGELHQRPWRDFSHNRNHALKLAGGAADYLLFIDADELLAGAPELRRTTLVADAYHLRCEDAGTSYARCALVAARLPWRWQGVVHEFLVCDRTFTIDTLAAPRIVVSHDGARSRDASTYLRDAALLEESVRGDPDNTRNVFYLAQSYRDAGDLERSRDWYARRAAMGGWDEEVWFALYQIALLEERIGCDAAVVSASYLRAFQYRPMRAEPLVQLARYHRLRGEHALAFVYAGHAATVPRPPDLLFVDEAVYAWRALDELSISAFYVGRHADGRAAVSTLLGDLRIPPAERSRILANAAFYGVTPRLQSIGESTPL